MTEARCPRCGKTTEIPPEATICTPCQQSRRGQPRIIAATVSATWRPTRRKRSRSKRR